MGRAQQAAVNSVQATGTSSRTTSVRSPHGDLPCTSRAFSPYARASGTDWARDASRCDPVLIERFCRHEDARSHTRGKLNHRAIGSAMSNLFRSWSGSTASRASIASTRDIMSRTVHFETRTRVDQVGGSQFSKQHVVAGEEAAKLHCCLSSPSQLSSCNDCHLI